MKNYAGSIAVLAIASALMTQAAHAQTAQPIPAWDHQIAGAARFVVLADFANTAVLDQETGLVWERAPSTVTVGYFAGVTQCLNNTTGGRKGWRVPSIFELSTLIDPTVAPPAPLLPAGHPFKNVSKAAFFWSSTRDSNVPQPFQWGTNTFDGTVAQYSLGTTGLRVWCVRAPSADSMQ